MPSPWPRADVVLVNGLQFEGFLQRLVEASATKASIVELTKGVEPRRMEEEGHEHHEGDAAEGEEGTEHAAEEAGHEHGDIDPHAFQSVHNAEIYVKNIADAFCTADAAGCDTYKANAETYAAKLEALDEEIKAGGRVDPGRQARHHHLARRLRLFRARIRHHISGAGRRLD